MKIRNGFVSNSSSSSFIVIDRENPIPDIQLDDSFVIGEDGDCEFGWDNRICGGVFTRINFALLQALHKTEWMDMFNRVLNKHGATNASCILSSEYDEYNEYRWAYIDHQSAAREGMNTEMFDSEEDLERFIFCSGSYIQGGNDNE